MLYSLFGFFVGVMVMVFSTPKRVDTPWGRVGRRAREAKLKSS